MHTQWIDVRRNIIYVRVIHVHITHAHTQPCCCSRIPINFLHLSMCGIRLIQSCSQFIIHARAVRDAHTPKFIAPHMYTYLSYNSVRCTGEHSFEVLHSDCTDKRHTTTTEFSARVQATKMSTRIIWIVLCTDSQSRQHVAHDFRLSTTVSHLLYLLIRLPPTRFPLSLFLSFLNANFVKCLSWLAAVVSRLNIW